MAKKKVLLRKGEITFIKGKPYLAEEHAIYGLRLKRIKTPEEIVAEREKIMKMAQKFGETALEEAEKLGHAIKVWAKKKKARKERQLKKEVK